MQRLTDSMSDLLQGIEQAVVAVERASRDRAQFVESALGAFHRRGGYRVNGDNECEKVQEKKRHEG